MSNPNRTARVVLRWTRLPVGWPIGVFICTPMRENETFVLLMQVVFVPLIVATGLTV